MDLDKEGFLLNLQDWSEEVAAQLAAVDAITLTQSHWEIVYLVRAFHAEYQVSLAMRPLIKQVRKQLGGEKANSIYLLQLFPGSPAKIAARIAGLPKPANCL